MPEFTAKDVQKLRQATGAGMMDAKKALTENDGDFEAAGQWLREKGLAKVAKLSDRENSQGAVAAVVEGNVGAIVEVKCETDFSAKADDFVSLVQDLADAVVSGGVDATAELAARIDEIKIAKRENIEVGQVIRIEGADGDIVDSYLHLQDGRGVNAVLVQLRGGTRELAHDIAVHIAFTKPPFLTRDEVPAAEVDKEREALLEITKAEGKPEQAWPKIVEGRLTAWYKERVLLEQGYVKDDKQSISQMLGDAELVRFAQVYIGA
ncbi:MAG: translation elongation factor Ts [Acidimicrobiales bacterium]|nr:translation elongation factor Ts [Acidimicrobiales bacterium]